MIARNTIIILFCAASTFCSCHKSGGSSSGGATIYTAGAWGNLRYSVAAYWVNGRLVSLTDTTHSAWARAIYVSGSDVYAAGMIADAGTYTNAVPVYWKNGAVIQLGSANNNSIANSIVVSNGIVYVAGDDDGFAAYWVNGTVTRLSNAINPSQVMSLAVSGNDVYVVGEDSALKQCFWKNGQVTELPGANISATAIAVSGSDVYIAGQQEDLATGKRMAVVWDKGTLNTLSDGSQDVTVNAISIVGTDVYVCGNAQGPLGSAPMVWKNGQLLSTKVASPEPFLAWGVAAVNGTVYLGGYELSPTGTTVAAYWSAAGLTELDKNQAEYSYVWGIFVN